MSENRAMSGVIGFVDRVLTWFSLLIGGATLIIMTVFSVWNVLVMRKTMNSPIVGAEDILILLLVSIVALSIPLGARTGAHIEIEVLEPHMSKAFAKGSLVFMKLLCIPLLVTMAWRLLHSGQSAARFGETTQQLLISYEYFYYALAVSVGLYAIVLVLDIWQLLTTNKIVTLKFGGGSL